VGLEEGERHEVMMIVAWLLQPSSTTWHCQYRQSCSLRSADPRHASDFSQAEAPVQGPVAGHNRWDTAEFTTDADKDKFHRLMVSWQLPAAVHCLKLLVLCHCTAYMYGYIRLRSARRISSAALQLGVIHLHCVCRRG
jgi:hypothetical protein